MHMPLKLRFALPALIAALFASTPTHAALPEGVTETSYVLPGGERVLELAIEVPAGVRDVWGAWATSDGYRTWAAPVAHIDLRAGGMIESSYDPAAKVGQRNNIRNQILALVPERLLLMRNVQAPAKTPFDAPTFQKTQTALLLTPLGDQRTRVTVVNSGYGTGAPWDGVYEFFRQGNAWVLAQLRARFENGPTDWSKTQAPGSSAGK
jgi:uncharacterized protein YndB with AHSA1/START domain